WRDLDAPDRRESLVDPSAETVLTRWFRERVVQDRPYLGLHRAAMAGGTDAQLRSQLLVHVPDRQRRHPSDASNAVKREWTRCSLERVALRWRCPMSRCSG